VSQAAIEIERWPSVPLLDLLASMESGSRPRGGVRGIAGGVASVGGEHLNASGGFNLDTMKYVPRAFFESMRRGHIRSGDVLIVKDGATTGKVALVRPDFPFREAVANEHVFVCRPESIDSDYLFWFLRSPEGQRRILEHFRGSAQGGITQEFAAGTLVPVAPPAMQRAIAAVLAAANERSSSAIERLAEARLAVERARRAILAAACSGRLTRDWREQHPHAKSVQTSIAARTSKRRRARSEQTVELPIPELPQTYIRATVGACAEIIEYGTSEPCQADLPGGIPVLRMGNIQEGFLDLRNLKYRGLDSELKRLILSDGDLLFNRTNSPELVGKSAVFHETRPMSFASYLIRVRFRKDLAEPDYANYWINSAWGREWARLAKTDGVSQSNINGSKLSMMPLPLAPIEEQGVIVQRASLLLSRVDDLDQRLDDIAQQVTGVREAILGQAFRGDLLISHAQGS